MSAPLRIGCVVMAAGNGSRFGSNKLSASFRGKSLFCRALEAIPEKRFCHTVVVTQYPAFEETIQAHGFTCILNNAPELGISHTIQLGLTPLRDCDGVLFLVADQPLLRRESVSALTALWADAPSCIAALASHGKRGNPCLFPAALFPELLSLTGDQGGSTVIRQHMELLKLLEVPAEELCDVDTVQTLNDLSAL